MQDGTINYLNLAAITDGLRFLAPYLPFLPLRLYAFTRYLISSLEELRHDTTGAPVVRVLSRRPSKTVRAVGEQADAGSVIALLFLDVSSAFPASHDPARVPADPRSSPSPSHTPPPTSTPPL